MIERPRQQRIVNRLLARSPVVAILGARQVGKTTLVRAFVERQGRPATLFDLERSQDLARLQDAELGLRDLKGIVVLDEIQRRPDLFPTLRVLADRPRTPARFLVLGSASPDLLRQSSESLAGRIAYHELSGLTLDEVGAESLDRLWLRGAFPRSYLARSHADSRAWRGDFIRTFLERDVPNLGVRIPPATLERFWAMLAHYHGQIWNASELARSFGVSHHVMRRYLDALQATFMVRVLRPWTANIRKRQVKSPKVYVRDSGILHGFLDVESMKDLDRHPKLGASWEGFLLEAVIHQLGASAEQCYFWATHTGAELDLLVVQRGRRHGFEFKRTTAPRVTPSMRSALESLQLTRLHVVHAGSESFPLAPKIQAVAAERILDDLKPMRS
ncbi:MAG: ATP-binding protein [Planctomycetota bacterium]|jgi:predicted AAA+ superfamily ATPase